MTLGRGGDAVLWPLALVVGGGTVLAGRLAWRARRAPSVSGREGLLGRRTVVHDVVADGSGSVRLDGAWWRARRHGGPLQPGQTVRVVALEGLNLIVEITSQSAGPGKSTPQPPDRPLPTDQPAAKEAPS